MHLPLELSIALLALCAPIHARLTHVVLPRHRSLASETFQLAPRALVYPLSGRSGKLRDPPQLAPGSLTVAGGCRNWEVVERGATCYSVVEKTGVSSLAQFYAWNPSLDTVDCSNLFAGRAYCVVGPTTVSPPRSSSSSASAAAPTATPASGTQGVYPGDATYFDAGLGACGSTVDGSKDYIVAVSQLLYDSWPGATANPNTNPICGRTMKISYGAKSVVVRVQDRCEGCAINDVDLSKVAFSQLAAFDVGRMPVTWSWVSA